jgi:hypothetical protein
MRFLVRLAVLALAAFGAKALYDKLAPRKDQLRSTADDLLDRTATAARDVGAKVGDAASDLASTAQSRAADVRDAAVQGAGDVRAAAERARDDLSEERPTESTSHAGAGSGAR